MLGSPFHPVPRGSFRHFGHPISTQHQPRTQEATTSRGLGYHHQPFTSAAETSAVHGVDRPFLEENGAPWWPRTVCKALDAERASPPSVPEGPQPMGSVGHGQH
ncbi:uncharacterized protein LOC144337809 [Macaca mulatta]